ncbi:MAG TPA: hypothetical protein PK012_30865, partial [Blastocatellia bacterium]|nr:hypothetical protein [Blastocatellia bacterium]
MRAEFASGFQKPRPNRERNFQQRQIRSNVSTHLTSALLAGLAFAPHSKFTFGRDRVRDCFVFFRIETGFAAGRTCGGNELADAYWRQRQAQ